MGKGSEASGSERTESVVHTARGPLQWVVLLDDQRAPQRLPLTPGEHVLGRGTAVSLRIEHASVSREHVGVRVVVDGDDGVAVWVKDLGSRNQTTLRGQPLAAHTEARVWPGDALRVGTALLVLEHRRTRTTTEPAAAPGAARARLERELSLVAKSDISVVLWGETGTGKEVAARHIHEHSKRSGGPLVAINCAALPEQLLENELFGHERGAFSGAVGQKLGLIESAHGGTLFLDEVAELSPAVQAKLLRVLEDRRVQRLGATTARAVDVRIVCASHRALDDEVQAGRFREDLFFRLGGITVALPPLRERADEIVPFALRFLAEHAQAMGRSPPALSDDTQAALRAHRWPGNLRELKNSMERALVLVGDGDLVLPEHVPLQRREPPALATILDEKARITEALRRAGGNQTKAAELLGISRRTLVNRLNEHGLPRPKKP